MHLVCDSKFYEFLVRGHQRESQIGRFGVAGCSSISWTDIDVLYEIRSSKLPGERMLPSSTAQ